MFLFIMSKQTRKLLYFLYILMFETIIFYNNINNLTIVDATVKDKQNKQI